MGGSCGPGGHRGGNAGSRPAPGGGFPRTLPEGPTGAGNGRGAGEDPCRAVRREAGRHRGAAGEDGVGTGVFPTGGVI